jgi:hypothetical protein
MNYLLFCSKLLPLKMFIYPIRKANKSYFKKNKTVCLLKNNQQRLKEKRRVRALRRNLRLGCGTLIFQGNKLNDPTISHIHSFIC